MQAQYLLEVHVISERLRLPATPTSPPYNLPTAAAGHRQQDKGQ